MVQMTGDGRLMQMIGTLGLPRRLARGLHCRQQQSQQKPDDNNDHQDFNQCEGAALIGAAIHLQLAEFSNLDSYASISIRCIRREIQ
jgi:hypothetical protein